MRSIAIKALALMALVLGSLAILPEVREARADPHSYTAQRVGWYYNILSKNETQETDGSSPSKIYTTYWAGQNIQGFAGANITTLGLYLNKGGTPGDLSIDIRNDNAGKPGSTVYRTKDIPVASVGTSAAWINVTFTTPLMINATGKIHIVARQSGGSTSNYYYWWVNPVDNYRGASYVFTQSINSGGAWTDTAFDAAFRVYSRIPFQALTTTSGSQYWGSGASQQYRFNFTYAFPSGSGSRFLNVTYPKASYRVNVTTSGGSLISASSYTDASFNSTHRIVKIPEAVISVSGNSYCLYAHEWPAVYWLFGIYYENGTYKSTGSVQMANTSGTYTITLDSTKIAVVGTSSIPEAFSWSLGSYNRLIIPLESQENHTLTYFDGDPDVYLFQIRDFVGITSGGDCYLESWRSINGTDSIIERQHIIDTVNGVPLTLTKGRIYKIEIWDAGLSVRHEFGYFLPTSYNKEPTITLADLAFTDQAQMVSQYVRTEASREDPYTSIIVIYNNTLSSEYNADANLLVKKRDGTLVYNSTTSDDAHTWTVPGLTNTTDYIIFLTVTHEFWGTLKWTKVLSGIHAFLSPPDLGVLGTWGGIPSGNILSAGLILLVAGLFSFLSAGLGIFVVVVLSAGLIRLGWISSVSAGIIVVCLGLAIMLAMSQRLRR